MCGIFTQIWKGEEKDLSNFCPVEVCPDLITSRGPNSQNYISYTDGSFHICFWSSVLHLRGNQLVPQPVENPKFILQWNGEIYSGLEIKENQNDTLALLEALSALSICDVFSKIRGEYAFILFDKLAKKLYYGRDYFGRRSLLLCQQKQLIQFSSVKMQGIDFIEVPATGIFCIDLGDFSTSNFFNPIKSDANDSLRSIPVCFSWSSDSPLGRPVTPLSNLSSTFLSQEEAEIGLLNVLKQSIERRVLSVPNISEDRSPVALLFSGGIDSVVIAAITSMALPPHCTIPLVNVAFHNERFIKSSQTDHRAYEVPDRISGLTALKDLQRLLPCREWTFVMVNVSREEHDACRDHVVNLMQPSGTVMDLSIAIALWFAARGRGFLLSPDKSCSNNMIEITSKVLLLGMGADEQLGGYSRHRTAFESGGYPALLRELQREVDRISSRNLGRDDRCISDHGREARFPFLDEDLVNFLSSLPISLKCNLDLPRGMGEKSILRRLAKSLGFSDEVAFLPKRAIQFGAKTAKIENNLSGKDRL